MCKYSYLNELIWNYRLTCDKSFYNIAHEIIVQADKYIVYHTSILDDDFLITLLIQILCLS